MARTHTLKMFGTGQITIPKALRDKYGVKITERLKPKKGFYLNQ